jgi:hypothetical protein
MKSKEDKFLELIDGYSVIIELFKNNIIIYFMDQKNAFGRFMDSHICWNKTMGYTFVSDFIYRIYKIMYNMKKEEIDMFLKEMLYKHLKIQNVIITMSTSHFC